MGTDVEKAGATHLPEGLEGVEASDLALPILRINHKTAEWINSLSGEELDEVEAVLLGMMKQRILWPVEVSDDGSPPICQSIDFRVGRPMEGFPVKVSGFDKKTVASAIEQAELGPDGDSDLLLPCKDCGLKDWGSHPSRDVPWCSEVHTYPLFLVHRDEDGAVESFERAVLSVSKTGIKPSKGYVTSFVSRHQPMYTAYTLLTLKAQSRGTVDFAVPNFKKIGETAAEDWPEMSATLRAMQTFLLTPRAPSRPTRKTTRTRPRPRRGARPPRQRPVPSRKRTFPTTRTRMPRSRPLALVGGRSRRAHRQAGKATFRLATPTRRRRPPGGRFPTTTKRNPSNSPGERWVSGRFGR